MTDLVITRDDGASIISAPERIDVLTEHARTDLLTSIARTDVLVQPPNESITSEQVRVDVVSAPERTDVLVDNIGPRGPVGPAGASGANEVQAPAAQNLSGHRAVYITSDGKLDYASNDVPAHAFTQILITTSAAMQDATAVARSFGPLIEPTWNWTPLAAVFLGLNGALTQTVPTTGFLAAVAFATAPTQVFITPRSPIILN